MGLFYKFFSKIFGKSTQNYYKTYISEWLNKYAEKYRTSEITIEILFFLMIYTLYTYIKTTKDYNRKNNINLTKDEIEQFYGDAALFELGCYFYFNIDLWLVNHKPDYRKEISDYLAKNFIELFKEALNVNNLAKIFEQRISGYRKLAKKYSDIKKIKKFDYHLTQLVSSIKNNKIYKEYNFEEEAVMISDAFKIMRFKMNYSNWYNSKVPLYLDQIKKYCNEK